MAVVWRHKNKLVLLGALVGGELKVCQLGCRIFIALYATLHCTRASKYTDLSAIFILKLY